MLAFVLLALSSMATLAAAQDQVRLDVIHNTTVLTGTWSSGFGMVETGMDFCDVEKKTFNVGKVAGISYSFTEDGFWEQAEFRFESNPAKPSCPTAKILFQHGTFTFETDGSLILTPFIEDGLVQVQNPCSAHSSSIQQFNATILISQWRIFTDPITNAAHLHLFRFDGAPYNKMVLRSVDAKSHMHPTEIILKPTPTPPRARFVKRNAASSNFGVTGAVVGAVAAISFGVASVLL
ncbi:chaperone for protein-folding within the ER, fungal-domain-containing protein [Auriculariales sp. MPI-PUGE-AT-0066]|nr:chaperone for protein-folding within the ER, fungal-domain-containing protein [Auriculariales sp. MPI-PUGE-AT-0066]